MSTEFPKLKLAIPVGTGFVPADGGYNNALLHLNGTFDKYALDICEGNACYRNGRYIVAPTDVEYESTAPYVNGYHYFVIHNDGRQKLCMSLGHFDWPVTAYPAGAPEPGTLFPRGAVLGELNKWERIVHVHMGIWKMAAFDRYGHETKCHYMYLPRESQPFTGGLRLEGRDFPQCWPGSYDCYSVHANRWLESTNAAFCYSPLDLERYAGNKSGNVARDEWLSPAKTGESPLVN
jgi:hypothetical protein